MDPIRVPYDGKVLTLTDREGREIQIPHYDSRITSCGFSFNGARNGGGMTEEEMIEEARKRRADFYAVPSKRMKYTRGRNVYFFKIRDFQLRNRLEGTDIPF